MEQPIRILIVEDNVIIADDMQSMLEEIGYEIVDNVIVYEQAVEVINNPRGRAVEVFNGRKFYHFMKTIRFQTFL